MRKIIALILTLVFVTAVFSSCSKKDVAEPVVPEDTTGDNDVPSTEDPISDDLNEVNTLDEELNEEEIDNDMQDVENTLNNW